MTTIIAPLVATYSVVLYRDMIVEVIVPGLRRPNKLTKKKASSILLCDRTALVTWRGNAVWQEDRSSSSTEKSDDRFYSTAE